MGTSISKKKKNATVTYEQARGGVPWGRPRTPLTAALTDGSHARGGPTSRTREDAHAAVGTETLTAGRCLWPGGQTPARFPVFPAGRITAAPKDTHGRGGQPPGRRGEASSCSPGPGFPSLCYLREQQRQTPCLSRSNACHATNASKRTF